MPDEIRSEISTVIIDEKSESWEHFLMVTLFIRKGLTELDNHAFLLNCHSVIMIILLRNISHGTPSCLTALGRSLDVNNQHVNNVSILGEFFRAPISILGKHELASMTLAYRTECGHDSVLQSLATIADQQRVDGTCPPRIPILCCSDPFFQPFFLLHSCQMLQWFCMQ